MICTGLVSKTFEHLSPGEVVDLAQKAGLDGIEWSGGQHVPAGDFKKAKKVALLTKEASLSISSYGSYFRAGIHDIKEFEINLETAKALQAPTIRIWASNTASVDADHALWQTVISDSRTMSEMALNEKISVAFEYHRNTLTDTNESAYKLITQIGHNNSFLYWQPLLDLSVIERYEGLNKILPWLKNIHVFQWTLNSLTKEIIRHPIKDGLEEWKRYVEVVRKSSKKHYLMLEFIKDGDPKQFIEDACIMKSLLE